jgi:hypothetical protein
VEGTIESPRGESMPCGVNEAADATGELSGSRSRAFLPQHHIVSCRCGVSDRPLAWGWVAAIEKQRLASLRAPGNGEHEGH